MKLRCTCFLSEGILLFLRWSRGRLTPQTLACAPLGSFVLSTGHVSFRSVAEGCSAQVLESSPIVGLCKVTGKQLHWDTEMLQSVNVVEMWNSCYSEAVQHAVLQYTVCMTCGLSCARTCSQAN